MFFFFKAHDLLPGHSKLEEKMKEIQKIIENEKKQQSNKNNNNNNQSDIITNEKTNHCLQTIQENHQFITTNKNKQQPLNVNNTKKNTAQMIEIMSDKETDDMDMCDYNENNNHKNNQKIQGIVHKKVNHQNIIQNNPKNISDSDQDINMSETHDITDTFIHDKSKSENKENISLNCNQQSKYRKRSNFFFGLKTEGGLE